MVKDLSFEGACKIIKNEYPELANDIDKFLSIVLTTGSAVLAVPIAVAVGPAVLTPVAIVLTAVGTLSNLFGVKSEIFAISESIITKITSKRDKDALKMFERMKQAYTLTCYTSFFEALYRNKELAPLLKKIKMTDEEKHHIAVNAAKELLGRANAQGADAEMGYLEFEIDLPQPGDIFQTQCKRLLPLYQQLAKRIGNFFELESIRKRVQESGGQEKVEKALGGVPEKAIEYFRAQYYSLAMRYPEFAIWLNLQENEKNRTQLQDEVAEYSKQLINLAENRQKTIDIGFRYMEEMIKSIPAQVEKEQTNAVLQQLEARYTDTVNERIIEDSQQELIYPKKLDIFIPQAFQVLHYTGQEQLEDNQTWNSLQKREDLSAFLLSYFNHPISIHKPLIILGQPGSGKSLLTSMLAARLIAPGSSYTPFRIALRHINPDAPIVAQIRDQVYTDTTLDRTWGELVSRLEDRPPLVLFDGYDELLQATGKAFFLGYIKDIADFQKEEQIRKPVRAIITSRISLIDKAVIPQHATIIRLLEFDSQRQDEWISLWNTVNSTYFEQTNMKPFILLRNNESISKLAEQPLLLMMLAIYDSEGNPLHSTKDIDQSSLYNELLRRFIERELKKDKNVSRSWRKKEFDEAIDHEMERLGVAAIGMFNRRKVSINREDLNADLKFFDLEKSALEKETHQSSLSGERDLLPAEKMFGSFFFQQLTAVRKSIGPTVDTQPQGKVDDVAYEFLHNTFGEFLTADFILHKILEETADIRYLTDSPRRNRSTLSQKVERLDGLGPEWFACFVYTPFFSRPVIVNLLNEWLQHCLKREQRNIQNFLVDFDVIVTNHINLLLTTYTIPLLTTKSDQRPFANLPTIGYLAIYILNLILLRTLLSPDGYTFDETKYESSIDGTRAWDSLIYLWHSWFSLETLNGLSAIFIAERNDTKIHLKIKKVSDTASSNNRLSLVHNVGKALADNITAGLSGLLLHDSFRAHKAELDIISKMLRVEQFGEPLAAVLFTKQLRHLRRETQVSIAELRALSQEFRVGEPSHKELWQSIEYLLTFNSESSASLLAEITRLVQNQKTRDSNFQEEFHNFVPGPQGLQLTDELTEEAIRLARETDYEGALHFFRRGGLSSDMLNSERNPTVTLLIELLNVLEIRGNSDIIQYIKREYLVKVPHSRRFMPIPLAIQMIKFAREERDQDFLDYFSQEYTRAIMNLQVPINIELSIELIKLVSEIGNRETLSEIVKTCISLVQKQEIHTRNQNLYLHAAALTTELLKAGCEIDNHRVLKSLAAYARTWISEEKRYLLPTGLSVMILKFAHKINDREIIDTFIKYYLLDFLQSQELVPIELAVEVVKLAQKQKIYPLADIEGYYRKNITVERCYLNLLSLDTIINIRRLAQIFSDNELAQRIDAKLTL
jgi:adenylate kinase family enzyme